MARMRFIVAVTFIVSTINILGQSEFGLVGDIKPLHTKRSVIEGFARSAGKHGNLHKYETDWGVIDVEYAKGPCLENGWRITKDTVLGFTLYPRKRIALTDVITNYRDLIGSADDVFTQFHTDRSSGRQFVVASGEDFVFSIRFTPSPSDAALRCEGFPPYDPVTDTYSVYQTGVVENPVTWDPGTIFATVGMIRNTPGYNGYIFVYCKRASGKGCSQTMAKVKMVVRSVLKTEASRIQVSLGGCRENVEIDAFVLRDEYPPAQPRPTVSCQQPLK